MERIRKWTVICCLLLGAVSCEQDDELGAGGPQEVEAEMQALDAEIRADIELACTNGSQCKYAGYGSKPCGGPASYLIYAASGEAESALLSKIEVYNTLSELYNDLTEAGSDCSVVQPPLIDCIDGSCVIVDSQ